MAQRRMFSLQIVDTDKFLDLPTSAQALYFHLGMHADDDGFVASPKRIMRSVGCREDDLSILVVKEFVIPFDSGVIVITDWKLNNTLKNDRYKRTIRQGNALGCRLRHVADCVAGCKRHRLVFIRRIFICNFAVSVNRSIICGGKAPCRCNGSRIAIAPNSRARIACCSARL